ncbi:MAG: thiamine-phosphate kinase [Candidatus Thermoplasmatota archaeon]|nr:thiamine-phosphate kinase [Candidatus Thermoplasmatota archaeon]MCL6003618.1 thiamine-phosphate kinase [Candidatus Thermoplasmatota archaeon]
MEISKSGERKLIDKIWKLIGEKNEDEDVHFLDIGKKYLLIAMDSINEGFHFERSWDPGLIGKFLVDINLSDIAAKNGTPLEMMVSFSFPRTLEEKWVESLVRGIKEELDVYHLKFSGGDLKESEKISLTGLIIGKVDKGREFRRTGARPGDYVYISSKIGKQERAILDYYNGKRGEVKEILDIRPRLDLLNSLRKLTVTSCVDNSDGIYKSLGLLAQVSGVKIVIENDVSDNAKDREERVSIFSIGGDYELIFTSPQRLRNFPLIGKVVKGKGIVDLNGKSALTSGFDHFRSGRRRPFKSH